MVISTRVKGCDSSSVFCLPEEKCEMTFAVKVRCIGSGPTRAVHVQVEPFFGSHGVGICTYADGSVYEGEWFADKRHGFGVLDYVNGDHFEGGWVEDKKEGAGVHFYFSLEKRVHAKRYDGEWVGGMRHGPVAHPRGHGVMPANSHKCGARCTRMWKIGRASCRERV